MAFSPDGKLLAAGGRYESTDEDLNPPGRVAIYDVETGKRLMRLKNVPLCVFTVAFSPDAKSLFTIGADGSLRVWDLRTGTETRSIKNLDALWPTFAISPDGRTVATSGYGDGSVKLWEINTLEETANLNGNIGANPPISPQRVHVAWSPGGEVLTAVGGRSGEPGVIRMWHVASGKFCPLSARTRTALTAVRFLRLEKCWLRVVRIQPRFSGV